MAELTTVDEVKAYLKSSIPDSFNDLIQLLIDAVCDRIEIYCNRKFAQDQYTEFQFGTWDADLILPNTPINAVLYAATGWQDLIKLTYSGTGTASIEIQESQAIVVEDLVAVFIPFDTTFKISELITALDALTNWTAEAADTDFNSCPAKSLNRRTYQLKGSTSDSIIQLSGAVNPISLMQRADGLYTLSRSIGGGTPILIIYDGGYLAANFPPALVDTATKMAAELFQTTTRESGLQSETIGDYSWTATDLMSVFTANSAQLDLFRRIPGTSG